MSAHNADTVVMSYEWPTDEWPKAVEAIKAKYPSIAAGSALAVLAEAGWALFHCGHEFRGPEGFCLECGAAHHDG